MVPPAASNYHHLSLKRQKKHSQSWQQSCLKSKNQEERGGVGEERRLYIFSFGLKTTTLHITRKTRRKWRKAKMFCFVIYLFFIKWTNNGAKQIEMKWCSSAPKTKRRSSGLWVFGEHEFCSTSKPSTERNN